MSAMGRYRRVLLESTLLTELGHFLHTPRILAHLIIDQLIFQFLDRTSLFTVAVE